MNKFEQLFNELSKVDDPTFLWLNWMDWVIDAWCELVDERNDDGDIIWLNRRMY